MGCRVAWSLCQGLRVRVIFGAIFQGASICGATSFCFFFFSLIMWSLKSLVQRCCLYRSIKFLIRSGDLAQLQPQLRLPLNLDHPRYCSPFHHSVVTCGPPLIQSQGAEVDSFVYWHDECLHGTIASGMRGIISTASSLSLLCFRIATELLVCRGQK